MKTIESIPISKISRASKLMETGAKVGVNYIKYYGNKMLTNKEKAKTKLNKDNAEDIYDGLKQLKGSALKVAQMLSMEKNILPKAYVEKFSLSQFSVPALSAPLVYRVFQREFGKHPQNVFDSFSKEAMHGASIGQVHKASKNGKQLAVKVQYPGVAQSISSDLAMVKPIAMRMFNIKKEGSESYFKEVEEKLIEETNYHLELTNSLQIAKECKNLENVLFPEYYPDLSTEKVLTMDWMNGIHFSEFTNTNTDQDKGNAIGQALWDFYMFQMHDLKKVHADPHPGNFLITKDAKLVAIDFGCMKEVPESFYVPYFALSKKENIDNPDFFEKTLYELEILRPEDSKEELAYFKNMFYEMLNLFTQPFHHSTFDFSDPVFFNQIASLSKKYADSANEIRKMNTNRGSKHFIYINRTFFGLYNLMFDLKASNIKINNYTTYL
ncbi:MAG: AarF/UbiB family protein [Flavobacteriaceae bacterium]|nr:AarF/UbiB family protein [Flavobacteriaceae bacterium]